MSMLDFLKKMNMNQQYNPTNIALGQAKPNPEDVNSLDVLRQYLNPSTLQQGNGPLTNPILQPSSSLLNPTSQEDIKPPEDANMFDLNKDLSDKSTEATPLEASDSSPDQENQSKDNDDDNIVEEDESSPSASKPSVAVAATPSSPTATTSKNTDDDEDEGTPTEFSPERLKELQNKASQSRQSQHIMKSASLLASGIAGADPQTAKMLAESTQGTTEEEHQLSDFMQRVQTEKLDPDSAYSAGLKDFMKKTFKIDLPDGISGADLDKTYMAPAVKMYDAKQAAQARQQIVQDQLTSREFIAGENRKGRESNLQAAREMHASTQEQQQSFKKEQDDNHRIDKLSKDLQEEQSSGRSAFGVAAKNKQTVDNLQALLTGNTDLNDIDNRQLYELARGLDRVVSGGGATISGSEHLTPDTLRSRIAHKLEFITNERQGAQAGDFITTMQHGLEREKNQADKQISKVLNDRLSAYRDLKDNARFQDILQQRGVDPSQLSFNKGSKSPQSQQQPVSAIAHPDASEASQWADQHINDSDPDTKAKAIAIKQRLLGSMNASQ